MKDRSEFAVRVALTLAFSVVGLLILEFAVRLMPRNVFLDPQQDAYWIARFRENTALYEPGSERRRNFVHDSELGWRMAPGHASAGVFHDERGLRRAGTVYEAGSGALERIVILGDSFTYGLGVTDDETYASQLEQRLPGYDVVNLGSNGHGTDQQYLMWQAEGIRLHPRWVLLGYYLPDFHRNGLRFREYAKPRFVLDGDALRLTGVPVPSFEALVAQPPTLGDPSLLLVEAFSNVFARVQRKLGFSHSAFFEERAKLTSALLQALHQSVREQGAQFGIILIPSGDYGAYPQAQAIEAVITETAEREEIALLDLTPILLQAQAAGVELYAPNGHWTAESHALATDHIATLLRELGLTAVP